MDNDIRPLLPVYSLLKRYCVIYRLSEHEPYIQKIVEAYWEHTARLCVQYEGKLNHNNIEFLDVIEIK